MQFILLGWQFWVSMLLFLISLFVAFFVPGDLIAGRLTVSPFVRVIVATVIGMVLFAWQGFIFGYAQIRWMTYVYLGVTTALWLRTTARHVVSSVSFKKLRSWKPDYWMIILIISGAFGQILTMWGNGLTFARGTYFCCGNQLDNIFQFALTRALVSHVPPVEPGMTGVLVTNYHYWFDLVVAELVRVFRLPLLPVLFQGMSIFLSLLYGLSVLALFRVARLSRAASRWALFFCYFGADLLWILLLAVNKNLLAWGLVSPLEDGSTFLANQPRAASMVVGMVGLTLFMLWRQRKSSFVGVVAMIMLATTIGFKVYTAFFFGMGIAVLCAFAIIKRQWKEALVYSIFFVVAASIYIPTNRGAGGLIFAPFFFVNNFIVQPAFHLERWEMARQIYEQHRSFLRVWQYELMFTVVTLFSLFGIKLIGCIQPWSSFKRIGAEAGILLTIGIIGSLFFGLFFLQQSGGANTFNFIVVAWLFLSLPAALALEHWLSTLPSGMAAALVIIVVLLSAPRIVSNVYGTAKRYNQFDYLFIENNELAAYRYLERSTPGTSVIAVDNQHGTDNESPVVYAFTGRLMYLSGVGILNSHNQKTEQRNAVKQTVFRSSDPRVLAQTLVDAHIDYLFLWNGNTLAAKETDYFLTKVFTNSMSTIWRVNRTKAREFAKYARAMPVRSDGIIPYVVDPVVR